MYVLKRSHSCQGTQCSASLHKRLIVESSAPEFIAAGNMYLRTWLKLANERCEKCRAPEHTMELKRFEALTVEGNKASLLELEKALTWAAQNVPRVGLKVVETPLEQIQIIVQKLSDRLAVVENRLAKWHAERLQDEARETAETHAD